MDKTFDNFQFEKEVLGEFSYFNIFIRTEGDRKEKPGKSLELGTGQIPIRNKILYVLLRINDPLRKLSHPPATFCNTPKTS